MGIIRNHDKRFSSENHLRLLGVFSIALGAVAITASVMVTVATMLIFGIFLIMAGVAHFSHAYIIRSPDRQWEVISGALYLTLGSLIIADPAKGALGMVFIVAMLFLFRGAVQVAMAITGQRWGRSPGWLFGSGLLNLLIAIFIFVALPESASELVGLFVGIELLLGGVVLLLAPRIVHETDTHIL